jgi:hypothetical protein
MNKFLKIVIAVLGGVEAVFSIGIPVLVALVCIKIGNITGFIKYSFFTASILASFFRAIKIGTGGDYGLYFRLIKGIKKDE